MPQTRVTYMNEPIALYFTARWCAPCTTFGPVVDRVMADHPDVRLVKVDVDEQRGVALANNVMSMPTVVLVKGGREVGRVVNAVPEDRLRAALKVLT